MHSRTLANSSSNNITFPVNVRCSKDDDLVLKVYTMDQVSAVQEMRCCISLSPLFAQPSRTPGRTTMLTGGSDIDYNVPRQLRIVATFEDRNIVPNEVSATATATSHPTHTPHTSEASHNHDISSNSNNDESHSTEVDADIAFATMLQRQFDLEAQQSREYSTTHPEQPNSSSHDSPISTTDALTTTDIAHTNQSVSIENGNGNTAININNNPTTATATATTTATNNSGNPDSSVNETTATATSVVSADEQMSADEVFARELQAEFEQQQQQQQQISSRFTSPDGAFDATALLRQLLGGDLPDMLATPQHRRRISGSHPLNTLPTSKIGGAQLGSECEICYEPYELGETFRTLPCMHRYHRDCIDPWLLQKQNPLCPLCNTPVSG